MRILIVLIIFIFSSSCFESDKEAKQKREVKNFLSFLVIDLITKKITPTPIYISCSEDPYGKFTNLKSIDIYFNNSFLINNPLDMGFIELGVCENRGKYWVTLKDNSKLKTLTVYYKVNQNSYEYTGIKLDFKDNTSKEYIMSFNGDPNTFTEFTVGEYRFVAVR